jgi:hypothetical protein
MTAWLLAALERLPPRRRRAAVGSAALLLIASAISVLIREARPVERHRRPQPAPAPVVRQPPATHPTPPSVRQPVSAAELRRATEIAERFAVTYLSFAYGRTTARSVVAVEPALRSQLIRGRSPVTPIEHQRHPRLVSLHTIGTMPGFVVATATVRDGGIAAYRLRFSLREHSGRWLVGSVEEG